jgi:hypothetical protein
VLPAGGALAGLEAGVGRVHPANHGERAGDGAQTTAPSHHFMSPRSGLAARGTAERGPVGAAPHDATSRVAGTVAAMGKLLRRTLDGDLVVAEWSADDQESVRAAAETLRREVDAGYVAVLGGKGRNEPVSDLPAEADVVILTMPMGGG